MTDYNEYHQGQIVTVTALFSTDDGAPIDPTTVVLKVRKADKTVTTYATTDPEISHPETGTYEGTIDTEGGPEGVWYYRWESSGSLETASEFGFLVKHSNVLEPSA